MSDAPERVWVDPDTLLAYTDDHGDGHPLYVRADIHQREMVAFDQLEAEVARLREALDRLSVAAYEIHLRAHEELTEADDE